METDQEYLQNRVRIEDGCWIWQLSKDKDGYGVISKARGERAHRLAYDTFIGPRHGKHVLHTCDNPSCCNPAHLYLGTQKDNNRDRIARQRFVGENHPTAKYSDAQIQQVAVLYEQGLTQIEISRKLGMSPSQVSGVLRGQRRGAKGVPTHRYTRYSDAQIQEVRILRQDGLTHKAIALKTGISLAHIKNILTGRQRKVEP